MSFCLNGLFLSFFIPLSKCVLSSSSSLLPLSYFSGNLMHPSQVRKVQNKKEAIIVVRLLLTFVELMPFPRNQINLFYQVLILIGQKAPFCSTTLFLYTHKENLQKICCLLYTSPSPRD